MPCFLSTIQSPIQAWLRPATWLPGINRLHSHREQWVAMSGTAEQLVDELIQAVDRVAEADTKTTYAVKQVDRERCKVQIYNWTWAEWLDVVEIEFRDGANGGVEAKCHSFSSGFLPTWFPLCFILNVILFFIPFYDNKFNSIRLERLRVSMVTECRLVLKGNDRQPSETTPIITRDTPTTPPLSDSGHSPLGSDGDERAGPNYQGGVAKETESGSPPAAVIDVEAEPSVSISDDHVTEEIKTDAVVT